MLKISLAVGVEVVTSFELSRMCEWVVGGRILSSLRRVYLRIEPALGGDNLPSSGVGV